MSDLPIIKKIQSDGYLLILGDKRYHIHINQNDDKKWIFDYTIRKFEGGHTAIDYLNKWSTS